MKTKGSFQRKIELHGEYPLMWHVVPTPYLKFQAVIWSDITEQASVYFHKESVQFRKHQDKSWSVHMQVYGCLQKQSTTNYENMRREIFKRSKQKIKEPAIGNERKHLDSRRET
ncbi:transposon Tf2-9 polyprotein [Trichonephila clavipes]|nr:transposon Tf2-9 polyprotein [Trichonephila clavipes]